MLSAANLWIHDLFTVRFYTADQGALNINTLHLVQKRFKHRELINKNMFFRPFGVNDWT